MSPELIFFAVTALIRVGTATRDALEQKARDEDFQIVLAFPDISSVETRLDEFFNRSSGLRKDLTQLGQTPGPLAQYWVDNATGGEPAKTAEAYTALLSALGGLNRPGFDKKTSWISLRAVDEEALVMIVAQWSRKDRPIDPWARVALAIADVGLSYVATNPGIVSTGSSGEKFLQSVCANLGKWIGNIQDGTQAYFLERMAAAVVQSGLQALSENSGIILTEKSSQALLSAVAKPLADMFAEAVSAPEPGAKLTVSLLRDRVFPQMVSAGLTALAEHEQALLGDTFDPNKAVGALTKGFLQSLAKQPVNELAKGDPQAWLPVYQSLLRSVAASANVIVPGTAVNEKLFQTLIEGMATTLATAPLPYDSETFINLGLVVVDSLEKNLPSRTQDPWVLLVPSALKVVVEGLNKGGSSIASIALDDLNGIVRVILAQVAATPGMLVGNTASVEVQAIISGVASAMAKDKNLLISSDGWTQIAAAAASAAARNPGKLFAIGDATPEAQLANKLITTVLTKAAAGLGSTRSSSVVLFGETLVGAIKDTLTAAAGNAKGALQNIDIINVLIDRLNKLVADPAKPIGAADWSWLYRNLVADAFDKGTFSYTDEQLRKMLYGHLLPGVKTP